MTVKAPYNFVPLSRWIFLPDWADQVSQDIPFEDGLSGELKVQLTCHTPTLVGGAQKKATEKAPGEVEFMKDPNGNPVIPGSSLKGMLRNVLEIASFGKFSQVADKRYGVRDLSQAQNFYLQQFPQNRGSQAGWLRFDSKRHVWTLQPCQKIHVKQQSIVESGLVSHDDWVKLTTAAERYEKLGRTPKVRFVAEPHKKRGSVANLNPQGLKEGHLVVTGQPAGHYKSSKTAKQWECIFYNDADTLLDVRPEVIQDFLFIHSESSEWIFWKEQRAELAERGIPVFYLDNAQGSVKAMGLASLFRLPYKHGIHDAIRHTQPVHIDDDRPDLAELIFGHLENANRARVGLRGRVSIGAAQATDLLKTASMPPAILNGPKPTYYPAYIAQPVDGSGEAVERGEYQTLMSQKPVPHLRGWKRYPTRQQVRADARTSERPDNNAVAVVLNPVPCGSKFEFPIRFHNLTLAELGALLWSLDFGELSGLRHGLGMGKPFGMGAVSLNITDTAIQHYGNTEADDTQVLAAARHQYRQMMEQLCKKYLAGVNWLETPQIRELLEMAKPVINDSDLRYMSIENPKEFADAKNQSKVLASYGGSSPGPDLDHIPDIGPAALEQPMLLEVLDLMQEEKHAEQARQKAEAEKQQARELMTETELRIDMLGERVSRLIQDSSNSTLKNDLNKQIRMLTKVADCWSDNDKNNCRDHLARLESAALLPNSKHLSRLQKKLFPSQRTEEENTRTTGSTVGGAVLGASLGGPFGAILGGIAGAILGESVNYSTKNIKISNRVAPKDDESAKGRGTHG